jgi:hypothetical protein
MNKVRHMCYGCRFVWVTDCYAVKFILLYDGANQAVLRLQMLFMGWDVDIDHQTNDYLIDANYWSWLDSDLCYDPSFRKYLHLVSDLRKAHPPPTPLPMKAEHMPYYRGPHIPVEHCPVSTSTDDSEDTIADNVATTLVTSIITQGDTGQTSLCVYPVQFGLFSPITQPEPVRALYNNEFQLLLIGQ